MKKKINVLIFAGLALSLLSCSNNQQSGSSSCQSCQAATLNEIDVDVYMNSLSAVNKAKLNFIDEGKQIPYIELGEALRLRKVIFDAGITYETPGKSTYSLTREGKVYTITLNNRGKAAFDVEKQTFYIENTGLLQAYSYNDTPYDILPFDTTKSSSIKYVTHQTRGSGVKSFYYLGSPITIPLSEYGIAIHEWDEKVYVPLDLFNNFFLSYTYTNLIYSGKSIYVFSGLNGGSVEYLARFYSENSKQRSEELAEFSYNSLLLNLNYQYGLSKLHGFSDFRTELAESGLKDGLLSTDGKTYLNALYTLIYNSFGDGHCSPGHRGTYINAKEEAEVKSSFSNYNIGLYDLGAAMKAASAGRKLNYAEHPEYNAPYYVDGDTAYVTFDSFSLISAIPDYYTVDTTGSETDAFGVIGYANKMIKSDPNVKNVVVDLTCNSGGEEIALIFALGWMLGDDARVCISDPLTHSNSTTYYHADVNFDGKYDEADDTLKGYNKFILTSKGSYSCANALPCLAKASEKVKIIGQTSGGGTCQVFPLITTDGTVLNISGNSVLSTESNSHYQNIDNGATPDFTIDEASKLSDREYTTKVVHSLVI